MKASLIVLVAGLLYCRDATAQFTLSGGAGICTFSMRDLKGLNEDLTKIYGVDGTVQEDFPAYVGFDFKASYMLWKHDLGAFYSHNSTGSRVSYEDYSGMYSFNQVLTSNQYGLSYGRNFSKNDDWLLIASFRVGMIKTNHNIESYIMLGSSDETESADFESVSITVNPGFLVGRNLLPWLGVSIDMRYLGELPQNLHVKGDKDTLLVNEEGTPVAAQWSGLRIMGLVYFRLSAKREAE